MSLVPASARAAGPARSPRPGPPASSDGYTCVEDEVARTADLVLKLHRLLERAEGLEAQPERAARMARLAWAVEHGRVALCRAAGDGAGGARDGVPQPRDRGC